MEAWNKGLTKNDHPAMMKVSNGRLNFFNKRDERLLNKIGEFTKTEKQILYGSLLGDGHLMVSSLARNAIYMEGHCKEQEEYALWKANQLERLGVKLYHYSSPSIRIRSRSLPQMTLLHSLFYPNGIKIVPRKILDEIDALGIAVWYMDDGSYNPRPGPYIYTNGFTVDEVKMCQKMFKERFGFKCSVYTLKNRNHQNPHIRFARQSENAFFDLIRPYIVPSMHYKIV